MRNIFDIVDNFAINKDIESKLLWGDLDRNKHPKASILMPVFSHPDYFRLSLKSAIEQDYNEEYEIVVVDNNDNWNEKSPNQEIVEELNNPKVLYYRNEKNIGMLGNWNRCIELAHANFVTYCHDDDMLLPNCLSRLMFLQKKHGDKAIFSAYNTMDDNGNITSNYKFETRTKFGVLHLKDCYEYTLYDQMLSSVGFGVGCLFAKYCLMEIGGYSQDFYPSADYALQAHYTFRYGSIYNSVATFRYRIAENESLKIYDKFADADIHFRNCMVPHICLPNFILNRINKANYNVSKIRFAIKWGHQDPSLAENIPPIDQKIIKIAKRFRSFHRYKFSL